ncbi:MAG TPA: putative Ig domain-containing protein [Gammaproteobacteria bacterium]
MDRGGIRGTRARCAAAVVWAVFFLGGCGGDDDTSSAQATPPASTPDSGAPPSTPPPSDSAPEQPPPDSTPEPPPSSGLTPNPGTPPKTDSPPRISGSPASQAVVGRRYDFRPTATDPDGDPLSFSIANRPPWASFDASTGRLTGTPRSEDIATYPNVTIQVEANGLYDTLPPFAIEVVAVGSRGVTLTWLPPTQNEDGSELTDLAGYVIRYGEKSGVYTENIVLEDPELASYVVEGLVPGTYYFVIAAFNSEGTESRNSNEKSATL